MSPFTVLTALGTVQQLRASINGWSHRVSLAAMFGGAAFVLGLVALIFLAITLFLALSDALSPVAAAGIVTALFVVLAVIAGLLARRAITRGRGGTGLQARAPATLPAADPIGVAATAFGAADPRLLLALGAGLVGGLLATQLRTRGCTPESHPAAE
jgi:hypothetical protein